MNVLAKLVQSRYRDAGGGKDGGWGGENAQVLGPDSPEPLSITEGFHLRREM